MSEFKEIGSLIVSSPDVRGGRPRIAETGVTVRRVVSWYELGLSPEEIVNRIGHLNLAQVHAALAYYHANSEEIEADQQAEQEFIEKLKKEHTVSAATA